jgi:tetratricopeptide (TPR) repeat protein
MKRRLLHWLCAGLATLALWLLPNPAMAQAEGNALALGKASLEAGRFDEAVVHLQAAFREDPANAEVSFLLGQAAFGAGNYEAAAAAFDRVLIMRPDLDRARLELARTYAKLQLYTVAEELFREVAARPDTPENVRRNIDEYLSQIRAARSPHRFSGALTLTLARDDNARVSPQDTIILPNLPPLNVPIERDWFSSQSLVLEHRWTPRPTGLTWASELLAYDALYLDQDDLNVQYLRLDSGPRWALGRTLLGLGVNGAYMEKDCDRYLGSWGARAFASVAAARNLSIRLDVSGEERTYWRDPDASGPSAIASLRPTWTLGRHAFSAEAGAELHDADKGNQTYDRAFAGLGYQLSLPWRLSLLASYRYENWLFDDPEPLASSRRRDRVHGVGIGLRRLLGTHAAVELHHKFDTSHSSNILYDYDRNVTSLSVIYAF